MPATKNLRVASAALLNGAGFDLDTAYGDAREVQLDVGGHTVRVSYIPQGLTKGLMRRLRPLAGLTPTATPSAEQLRLQDDAIDLIADNLLKIVTKWNLTRGGKPIPVSAEALDEDVPLQLMTDIWGAIQTDNQPGETPGVSSAAG